MNLLDKAKIKFIRLFSYGIKWNLIYKYYRIKYDIHPTFHFNGRGITLYGRGKIILDAYSYMGKYSSIQSVKGCKVYIGKHCRIAPYVMIYTLNAIADQDFSKKEIKSDKGNVIINDYCWVGVRTYINQNVEIGENSVIGAHSVVNRNIPPHSIAVGVPAKVIKFKSYLEEEKMLKLAEKYKDVLHPKLKLHLLKRYGVTL